MFNNIKIPKSKIPWLCPPEAPLLFGQPSKELTRKIVRQMKGYVGLKFLPRVSLLLFLLCLCWSCVSVVSMDGTLLDEMGGYCVREGNPSSRVYGLSLRQTEIVVSIVLQSFEDNGFTVNRLSDTRFRISEPCLQTVMDISVEPFSGDEDKKTEVKITQYPLTWKYTWDIYKCIDEILYKPISPITFNTFSLPNRKFSICRHKNAFQNYAVLIRTLMITDAKYRVKSRGFHRKEWVDKRHHTPPVVWSESNPETAIEISLDSLEASALGENQTFGKSFEGENNILNKIYPYEVQEKETKKLSGVFSSYKVGDRLRQIFTEMAREKGSFPIVPADKIKEMASRFWEDYVSIDPRCHEQQEKLRNFQSQIRQQLNADTLILLDITAYGLLVERAKRRFVGFWQKPLLGPCLKVHARVINLEDGLPIWNKKFKAFYPEPNLSLEDFINDGGKTFLNAMDEEVAEIAKAILRELTE